MLLAIFTLCVGTVFAGEKITINNPYDGVSWEKEHRHKANFHTHTTNSYDGHLHPHEVVDGYKELGYSALAITDHGKVTYPWTEFSKLPPSNSKFIPEEKRTGYEDRDPEKVGMTSIKGSEPSKLHHMVSLWSDAKYNRRDGSVVPLINDSKKMGGLMIFAHPGRYGWHKNEERKRKGKEIRPGQWTIEKYALLFRGYDNLLGLEVYNAGDKYPMDRRLWDGILSRLMPGRPVWGFSNDDMHKLHQMGRNQSILLVKEPTEKQIREALVKGQFFFAYVPKVREGSKPPYIKTITVDNEKLSISVKVDEAKKIEWISDGKVVGEGPTLELAKVKELGPYVRVMIYGTKDDTVIGTQPFGIVRKK